MRRRGLLALGLASVAGARAATTQPAAAAPRPRAGPKKLIVVIEDGGPHVTLVDGERFEIVERRTSRPALNGRPRLSPDGRYAYVGTRDGWIARHDLLDAGGFIEVHAGPGLRQIVLSSDGKWLLAAGQMPHSVVLFDAGLARVKTWPATARGAAAGSRIAAVVDAAPRRSFVVALQDIGELWEISYDPKAEEIYEGLVHDYRMGEGLPMRGFHNVRRTLLAQPLEDVCFDPEYSHAVGAARTGNGGATDIQIVNLDVRRRIAGLAIAGIPHLASGFAPASHGARLLALPNLERGAIDIVAMQTWKHLKTIATPGPGLFLHGHPGSPYAWSDSILSASAGDTLTVTDLRELRVVAQVRQPGKTLAPLGYTHDGRHVLASLWHPEGALIVYDAQTFTEVQRLPMSKPVAVAHP